VTGQKGNEISPWCDIIGANMKVFLSWSGQRSKAVADVLAKWTPHVIQAVEPWISSAIDKGARWQSETAARLEDVKVGIVCLTPGNLSEPWILFEAGALSKTTGSSVCTFLLDLTPADIAPPLAQFQHTTFQKEDVLKVADHQSACLRNWGTFIERPEFGRGF
jgi:hypothetical protein